MARYRENLDAKIYVGGLPDDASTDELEDSFRRYGKVKKVWVARRPPGFAFVEMEDPRDAEDAVRGLDGGKLCGVRARVELSHGRSRNGRPHRGVREYRRRSPRRSPVRRSRSPRRSPRSPRSRSRSPRRDDRSPRRSLSRSRSRSVSPKD